MAQLMRGSKGYDRVAVSELYDANATRDAVLGALRVGRGRGGAGRRRSSIYLAGHGIAIRGGWHLLSPAVTEVEEDEIVRLSASAEQIAGRAAGVEGLAHRADDRRVQLGRGGEGRQGAAAEPGVHAARPGDRLRRAGRGSPGPGRAGARHARPRRVHVRHHGGADAVRPTATATGG